MAGSETSEERNKTERHSEGYTVHKYIQEHGHPLWMDLERLMSKSTVPIKQFYLVPVRSYLLP